MLRKRLQTKCSISISGQQGSKAFLLATQNIRNPVHLNPVVEPWTLSASSKPPLPPVLTGRGKPCSRPGGVFCSRPQAPGGAHPRSLASSHKLGRSCRWPLASCVFDFASDLASLSAWILSPASGLVRTRVGRPILSYTPRAV